MPAATAARRWRRDLRVSALGAAFAAGTVALGGIVVLRADAPELYNGLTGRGLPLVAASAVTGLASLILLFRHRLRSARVAAAGAVAAVVWGWAAGQYPYLLVNELTLAEGAGDRATLVAMLAAVGIGSALFAPPLIALLVMHSRGKLIEVDSANPTSEE